MKINDIVEATTPIDPELKAKYQQYASTIVQYCKPFLLDSGVATMYRVTAKQGDFVRKTVRPFRKPTASKIDWQYRYDEVFEQLGFPLLRSNCIFAAGRGFDFTEYMDGMDNQVYVVIPIGEYEVVWSPKVNDLYIELAYKKEIQNSTRSNRIYLWGYVC